MPKLSHAGPGDFKALQSRIRDAVQAADSYEEAAQRYTEAIYNEYKESIEMVRLFITIRYEKLPPDIKEAVDRMAASSQVQELLQNDTLVLTLAGSSGREADWNDRKKSSGHRGIPLLSSAFIDAIPMMSRLLKELGLGLDWIESRGTALVKKAIINMSGRFYVSDALSEVDQEGRKIIAAQDFVSSYKIKTVFGYGGAYLGTDSFFTTIIFLNELLEEDEAGRFADSMTFFKNISGYHLKNMFTD